MTFYIRLKGTCDGNPYLSEAHEIQITGALTGVATNANHIEFAPPSSTGRIVVDQFLVMTTDSGTVCLGDLRHPAIINMNTTVMLPRKSMTITGLDSRERFYAHEQDIKRGDEANNPNQVQNDLRIGRETVAPAKAQCPANWVYKAEELRHC